MYNLKELKAMQERQEAIIIKATDKVFNQLIQSKNLN